MRRNGEEPSTGRRATGRNGKSRDANPGAAKTGAAKTGAAKTGESKPQEAKSQEGRPEETEPATSKPAKSPTAKSATAKSSAGKSPAGKTNGAETATGGAATSGADQGGKRRIAFIDIGRAIGALLVVYTHFDMLFLRENKDVQLWVTQALDTAFVSPMRFTDQGIGAVAIPFFFLASGFVITPIALRLGASRFAVNRVFRVYPLLIFVVAVSAGFFALGLRPLTTGTVTELDAGMLLSNISLVNFLQKPLLALVGVAWTLAVEVLFYLLVVALLPLLRRNMWLAIAVELEIVLLVLATHAQFGENYRAIAVNVAYLVMPIAGQVLWAVWARHIKLWLASCYLLIAWGLFVWAGELNIDPDYIPRAFPFVAALLLFLLGLFAEERMRERKAWTALSERTYSIYLLHGAIGFPVMFLVYDHLPVWLTLGVGVLATAIGVEIAYRLVERPSHNLGRRLSRRGGNGRAASKETTPVDPEDAGTPERSGTSEDTGISADRADTADAEVSGDEPAVRPESPAERTDVLPRRTDREPGDTRVGEQLPRSSGELFGQNPAPPRRDPGIRRPVGHPGRGNGEPGKRSVERRAWVEPDQGTAIRQRLNGHTSDSGPPHPGVVPSDQQPSGVPARPAPRPPRSDPAGPARAGPVGPAPPPRPSAPRRNAAYRDQPRPGTNPTGQVQRGDPPPPEFPPGQPRPGRHQQRPPIRQQPPREEDGQD
ncbi:peptidoglycan/LPS O-acetylase OafA/YrhL [Tamaricihabitans halophyticus]|uniref:Peptidoglycan/LPS O-acetylase OafA/YrhL n=1 Tax=Tamaricihabitans halophyticus TaxID=1262583 RepID=A0A4R2QMR5_9PSEU|nr:acyltransferase family protein [Tamaricihabitans halophyticus]TCP50154.1 peptidoglycan/LPS O-acetylase OafA/YrhL [Tamaricihabitans halophyticus]